MLLDLWHRALKSSVGISIQTDNRVLLRQHLYRARADSGEPSLDSLVMIMPEQEDEIWLVHKDADSRGTDNQSYPKLIHP